MGYSVYVTILPILTIFLTVLARSTPTVFSGHYVLFQTTDCNKHLDVYKANTNGQWPAKIKSPEYDITTYRDADKKMRMRLNITWESDIKNVKGFEIVLKPSGMKQICFVLDYSGSITNSSSGVYSFQFNFNNIYQHRNFKAEFSPLPSRDNTTVRHSKFDTVDCSIFSSEIFSNDYDGRFLFVNFLKGPEECDFKKYEVGVYDNSTQYSVKEEIVPTKDNVDKLEAIFDLNISEGYYFILVGIHREDPNECLCKDRAGVCHPTCMNSKSNILYLLPAKRYLEIVADEPVEPDQNQLLLPFGIVIGLLLLIALVLNIVHWKFSVYSMVRKRGIVLLLDDHEHHTNAVTKVVDYLNEYHLKVYLASTFPQNPDIPDQMVIIGEVLKSDFVLLVLSPALQKRMEAWDKQQDYVEFFKEKNSNILSKAFLEVVLHSNKLFVCKFDHAAEFGCWPKPCYSLPSDLTRMVAELSGQSFSQRLILCNCLKSNALQRELQIAIRKMIMYEQSHSNWFLEKYVCPTNITVSHFDEMSQESGIGQSEYTNPPKLKEIFSGYKDTFFSLPEESITAPSIYSAPISERLEAINKRNL